MTIRKLPTMQEKVASLPAEKPHRNRAEFGITNGFEFGLGFWSAWLFVSIVGVPAIMCGAFILLSILGISLGSLGR